MGKNPVVAVVAIIVIIVAVILIARRFMSPGVTGAVGAGTFYDVGKKEVYPQTDPGAIPPVKLPSGNEGVRAWVYSCSSCDDKTSHLIGYLEKYTEEGKAAVQRSYDMPTDFAARAEARQYRLIRREDDKDWVDWDSMEGEAILAEAEEICAPAKANHCSTYVD